MLMVKKIFSISLPAFLLAGCSTEITNLTPRVETRNANGFYHVEAALHSTQETLRWNSVKPSVLVGTDVYSMQYTAWMTNRWETLIPAPANTKVFYYRFKFDFKYDAWGSPPKVDSKLSPTYRLEIKDQ